mmetsp:Transcript_11469/g.48114  ORF Transcript_11469/g.48114 Transcript_11469/m.48114 type:complete len:202 (+) Transcript_11469:1299-1904(+)
MTKSSNSSRRRRRKFRRGRDRVCVMMPPGRRSMSQSAKRLARDVVRPVRTRKKRLPLQWPCRRQLQQFRNPSVLPLRHLCRPRSCGNKRTCRENLPRRSATRKRTGSKSSLKVNGAGCTWTHSLARSTAPRQSASAGRRRTGRHSAMSSALPVAAARTSRGGTLSRGKWSCACAQTPGGGRRSWRPSKRARERQPTQSLRG